jgi:hypothetical protein
MEPEMSRRLAAILGLHPVSMRERLRVVVAAQQARDWDHLPDDVKVLLAEIERRPR